MTEHQYNLKVKQSLELLENGNINDVLERLESLYKIKPIRLNWYIAKAKYIWKSTRMAGPAIKCLTEKSWCLYEYPGMSELTELYMRLVGSYHDDLDRQRHRFLFLSSCETKTEKDEKWFEEIKQHLRKMETEFLENPVSEYNVKQLLDLYFISQNQIMYYMISCYIRLKSMSVSIEHEWFEQFSNHDFLSERLTEKSEASFVLVEDEASDGLDEKITCYILQEFSKKVYYIKAPIVFEVDHIINIEDTVVASMDAVEVSERIYTIYPAAVTCKGEDLGDNREYLLNHILQNDLEQQTTVILTSGTLMDNLCRQPILKKNLERLYGFVSPPLESQMAFGWAGNYLSYISQVHDTDAAKLLAQPAECSYSIIIPARNSAGTLRYTLMSCLNQRYQGNYEIILSDNSTPGNTEVYQLYKELDDSRIKYYRTPREYNLSRSFEFAFLHAKGEFLLSLGSDDALLPWTLEVLEELRKTYPDEDVIQWERGFYAWPGFNGGQQHQFVIPRGYQKGSFGPEYFTRQFYFGSIFNNSDQMYLLPNLYLNSGCRRDYLKKILAKTGRLFDGICQDIYMGVVNAAINEKILNIRYPLTIAGMSGGSMGAKANMVYELKEDEAEFLNDLKKTANIGGYCASVYERMMPEVTTDKSSLYNCILRMIARGIIAESDLEHFDFRKWFLDVFCQMDIRDPLFDKKVHYFRYTASLHGEEFLKWFDENIYHKALTPRKIDEEKLAGIRQKKCYKEGTDSYGGQTLDASKYEVYNVYDASLLFEKISGL